MLLIQCKNLGLLILHIEVGRIVVVLKYKPDQRCGSFAEGSLESAANTKSNAVVRKSVSYSICSRVD